MKRRNLILSLLVLALVLSAGIGSAWAYFTTYASASGGMALHLGYRTEFEEEVRSAEKIVSIRYDRGPDNENAQEVYVRVRAWNPDESRFTLNFSGEGWTRMADGWWVYLTPLGPDKTDAQPFTIEIEGLTVDPEESAGQVPPEGDSINIPVVHECAPVLYNEDGSAVPATDPSIWAQELVVKTETPAEGGD